MVLAVSGALGFHAEELGAIPEDDFLGVWPPDQSRCVSTAGRGRLIHIPESYKAFRPRLLAFYYYFLNLLLETAGS